MYAQAPAHFFRSCMQPVDICLPYCADIIPPLNALGFWDTFRAWFLGLMQGLPKGRLLRYDPRTKEAHVIAKVRGVAGKGLGHWLRPKHWVVG